MAEIQWTKAELLQSAAGRSQWGLSQNLKNKSEKYAQADEAKDLSFTYINVRTYECSI